MALAAAAAENHPAQEGEVFPPGEEVIAVAAVRARLDDVFAFGKASQDDFEEAAEGEAEKEGEGGAGELKGVDHVVWWNGINAGSGAELNETQF